jgi:NAD(P)-dependent dehydrogenase (short-subunit alcohol dehydrogenase family)
MTEPIDMNGQPLDMNGQVVLVTGASRGLGKAFAGAVAGAGAAVALVARSESGLQETAAAIQAAGGSAITLACDVVDQGSVEAAVKEAERQLGTIDVLVNNAGVAGPTGHDWELDPAQWWKVLEVNVLGQFYFASAAMPGMVARGHGRVVNVSSAAAGFPSAGYSAYCTSKAALTMWTEALAGSAAHYGVSVMGYHPGFVRTDMTEYSAARPDTEVSNPIVEFIRDGLATGAHDTMEDAVGRLLQVAAGVYDSLPGRQIGVNDPPEKLLPRAGEIEERGLYGVRINELAE